MLIIKRRPPPGIRRVVGAENREAQVPRIAGRRRFVLWLFSFLLALPQATMKNENGLALCRTYGSDCPATRSPDRHCFVDASTSSTTQRCSFASHLRSLSRNRRSQSEIGFGQSLFASTVVSLGIGLGPFIRQSLELSPRVPSFRWSGFTQPRTSPRPLWRWQSCRTHMFSGMSS